VTLHAITHVQESRFAHLDFRPKLALMLTATFLAFLWESLALNSLLAIAILGVCFLARVRASYVARIVTFLSPFWALLVLTHGFFNTSVGRTALWVAPSSWWFVGGTVRLTVEGLIYGAMVAARTLILVLSVPLVVSTTDPNALMVGLARIGVPFRIAFVFSATLRFVPLWFDELRAITDALRLRGIAVEDLNLMRKLLVYSRIAVPLIVGALTRSQQVELALASRAFSGDAERTYLYSSTLRTLDKIVLVLCLLVSVGALWLRVTRGVGGFLVPGR